MSFSFLSIRAAKKLLGFTCLFTLCSIGPLMATTVFQVVVDTSAIAGTNGLIDFQLNPFAVAGGGTAEILGFSSTGGVLGGPLAPIGDVSGALPGTVTIANTTVFNDYTEQFTFGSDFSFFLRLDGTLANNTFFLGLYTPGFGAPLLTSGDFIGIVDIDANGIVQTPVTFLTDTGGPPVATFTPFAGEIPEPSTLPLCAGAIAMLCVLPKVRSFFRPARS